MAAGLGTRMRSDVPKHFHALLGRRMVDWVFEAAQALGPERVVAVASPDMRDRFDGAEVAVQEQPRGTADAVMASRAVLDGFEGDVLVLSSDVPLITPEVLQGLLDEHRRVSAAVTLLSFEPTRPFPYGRVVRGPDGGVERVVEEADATPEERAITELNTSIYVFEASALWRALEGVGADNAQGELYLTDAIGRIAADGGTAAAYRSPDPQAPEGVNTRADLAAAAAVLRDRINERHMLDGVTIVDPASTWIDPQVELDPDVVVQPFTVLRGTTRVRRGAEIGPHAVVIDAEIGESATVGPFCYVRPRTVLGPEAKAGTFVELKNTTVGARAKVPHLSYIGDAEIGEDTNVAAANVTANFAHRPGEPKKRTRIGRNVRTAVDNTFVAPVTVGDDAWLAPGAVITDDVPPGSLAGFAPRQQTKEGWVYEHGDERDDG